MTRAATALSFTELEVATGNFDTSRSPIDRVIIHTMVGTWQGAAARFDTYGSQVSAHYGVKLDGSLIHWLEESSTAYHAGDYAMNQRSIGIEHEDNGNYNGVRPDILYTESAKLVHDICTFYQIPLDRQHILKHSEVIATGCPDALDIDRIVREAAALNLPQNAPISQAEVDQLRNDRDLNWNLYQKALKATVDLTHQLTECQNKPAQVITVTTPPPPFTTATTITIPATSQTPNSTATTGPISSSSSITSPISDGTPNPSHSTSAGTNPIIVFLNWFFNIKK